MSEKQFDMSKLKPFSGDARDWAQLYKEKDKPVVISKAFLDALKKAQKK